MGTFGQVRDIAHQRKSCYFPNARANAPHANHSLWVGRYIVHYDLSNTVFRKCKRSAISIDCQCENISCSKTTESIADLVTICIKVPVVEQGMGAGNDGHVRQAESRFTDAYIQRPGALLKRTRDHCRATTTSLKHDGSSNVVQEVCTLEARDNITSGHIPMADE